ncbi:MAG: DUF2190 family protein [Puniceicoccales bacterium]|jgi:hypothetical protein|nr:DUF2190 family protein [Puniceicoccales bacterium]
MKKEKQIIFANVAEGTHEGNITFLAAEPIEMAHVLVALQGNTVHPAAAGELPIGVVTDEAEAADDPINVQLLGSGSTVLISAADPISSGTFVVGTANGKIIPLPSESGTYRVVGIALTTATMAGEVVEVLTGLPSNIVITTGSTN